MKGIPLHPLRLAALDRMTVLRVPFDTYEPRPEYVYQDTRPYKNTGKHCAYFWNGRNHYTYIAPYAPGDYFVKEAFNVCDVCYDDYAGGYEAGYPLDKIPREKPGFLYCVSYRQDGDDGPWRSATQMPSWAARYIVTLGPPVPCRLGEVTEEMAIAEGIEQFGGSVPCNLWRNYRIFKRGEMRSHCISPIESYRSFWNTIYPRHTDPGTWTWGYPMEVRRR